MKIIYQAAKNLATYSFSNIIITAHVEKYSLGNNKQYYTGIENSFLPRQQNMVCTITEVLLVVCQCLSIKGHLMASSRNNYDYNNNNAEDTVIKISLVISMQNRELKMFNFLKHFSCHESHYCECLHPYKIS